MAQLLCGVEYMHRALGIYHGDIKPANILINSHYQLQICDFGAVGCIDRIQGQRAEHKFTRWYRPPEVEYQYGVHARSDIWSLGCIGMEMLLSVNTKSQYQVLFKGTSSGFTPYSSSSSCAHTFRYDSQMHVTMRGLLQLHMSTRDMSLHQAECLLRSQLQACLADWGDPPPPPILHIDKDGTQESMPVLSMRSLRSRMEAELIASTEVGTPPVYAFLSKHKDTARLFLDMLHLQPELRPCAKTALSQLKMSIVATDTDDDHAHLCAGAVRLLMACILARAKKDVKNKLAQVSAEQLELQATLELPFHPDADAAEKRLKQCLQFTTKPHAHHLSRRLGGAETSLFPTVDTTHAAVVRNWFKLLRVLSYDDLHYSVNFMEAHFRIHVPKAQPLTKRGCRPRTA